MEVCGSISNNVNYTEFHLQCIYCSIEIELKDWEHFVSHIRQSHAFDDAEEISVNSEYDEIATPNIDEETMEDVETNNVMDIKEENEMWPYDNVDFDNNDFFYVDEVPPELPTEAVATRTRNSIKGKKLETKDLSLPEDETANRIDEEFENTSYESIDDEESSTDSDEPLVKKSSRTNPMSLKRKLKISFTRQNPRVFHFIQEFEKHPCLWNPDHPQFDDDQAQTDAHNAIIEQMDKKVNVLFTEIELKNSIKQLLDQYTIAAQKSNNKELVGMAVRYYNKCKFLSIANSAIQTDEEEGKSDLIQLNFKKINEMTSAFIETYANFPVLYDISLEDFKSLDARTDAYIKMSTVLSDVGIHVNDTEVHLAVQRLRKWVYMAIRRVKSKELRRACTKTELHYLQLCSFLPPKSDGFVITCEYCQKRFYIDYCARSHMVKVHNVGELPYQCSQCPRRFVNVHDMERHKLRQHCEKMLKCDYCDSTFSLKADLTVHLRVHTGEKPYICEMCGKSFRLKLLLDYHINGRHLDLRPFECDLCPKKYRKRVQLKNHMKAHLNIKDKKCEICGAAFSCPTSLCRHRKTHNIIPKAWKKTSA